MPKSLFDEDTKVLLRLLKAARKQRGITQGQLAEYLGITQGMVSKVETNERRLDVIELRQWCHCIGVPFLGFLEELESALSRHRKKRGGRG